MQLVYEEQAEILAPYVEFILLGRRLQPSHRQKRGVSDDLRLRNQQRHCEHRMASALLVMRGLFAYFCYCTFRLMRWILCFAIHNAPPFCHNSFAAQMLCAGACCIISGTTPFSRYVFVTLCTGIMFWRWRQIHADQKERLWKLYGFFTAIMCFGSFLSMITWPIFIVLFRSTYYHRTFYEQAYWNFRRPNTFTSRFSFDEVTSFLAEAQMYVPTIFPQ